MALLTFFPHMARQLTERGPRPLARHTITSPAVLEKVLEEVRRAGVACDREESHVGLVCEGVPIFSGD